MINNVAKVERLYRYIQTPFKFQVIKTDERKETSTNLVYNINQLWFIDFPKKIFYALTILGFSKRTMIPSTNVEIKITK